MLAGTTGYLRRMGHLKPGVTPAQAVADLNSIGAYLQKTYPKDEGKMTFVLTRPSLYGDYLGRPVQAFMAGLMLLTGLILLAACANLGSLFAARAADRREEVALRLALGSSRQAHSARTVHRSYLDFAGRRRGWVIGQRGVAARPERMASNSQFPIHLAVNPDAKVYAVAVLLALVSGLLFGAVPVRQVLADQSI